MIPPGVADQVRGALESVVDYGTGTHANYGGFAWGKTGTTENNGDAWFCGATEEITACVWVGHADSNEPMQYEYGGNPVDGGTYPADIWRQVVLAYEAIQEEEGQDRESSSDSSSDDSGYVAPVAPESSVPETSEPVPEAPAEPAPAPESSPAPSTSEGGGVSAG